MSLSDQVMLSDARCARKAYLIHFYGPPQVLVRYHSPVVITAASAMVRQADTPVCAPNVHRAPILPAHSQKKPDRLGSLRSKEKTRSALRGHAPLAKKPREKKLANTAANATPIASSTQRNRIQVVR